jgi:hypothetical protein
VFRRAPLRDSRVGELLGRTPTSLQAAIRRKYADVYSVVRSYRCRAHSCAGEFAQRDGPLHVTFGTLPAERTYLAIWTT